MVRWLALAVVVSVVGGCVKQGPRIRVSQATRAQFEATKDENEVWYEFQPGDVVPFQLIFFGALIGGLDQPMQIKAKKQFFLIARKNFPMALSFDGQSYAGPHAMQAIIAVVPGEGDAPGGQVGWMTYLGESGDTDRELEELANEMKKDPSPEVITR